MQPGACTHSFVELNVLFTLLLLLLLLLTIYIYSLRLLTRLVRVGVRD